MEIILYLAAAVILLPIAIQLLFFSAIGIFTLFEKIFGG